MKDKVFLIIDLKAFYASTECVDRGLDPFSTPLVVADINRGKNTIILSVTPFLKAAGIPSRLRLNDLPDTFDYIYALPRMSRYLEVNANLIDIMLDYFGEDDIHIYSIDEFFIDYTPYKRLYKKTPYEMAKYLKQLIIDKMGLHTSIGIGPNMFLAKSALDNEAKTNPDGIAYWTYQDVTSKLQSLKPLSKMFGISNALEKKLNNLGLFSIKDLATCPKELLIDRFGVIGEELHNHANGQDFTEIREQYKPKQKSVHVGQVLMRDYKKEEIPLILREMSDELSSRLLDSDVFARSLFLYIGYSKSSTHSSLAHQISLNIPTNDPDNIYLSIMEIAKKYLINEPIRRIEISALNVFHPESEQLDLFSNSKDNKKSLIKTLDKIRKKYGSNSVLRGTSALDNSLVKQRNDLIGGHKK